MTLLKKIIPSLISVSLLGCSTTPLTQPTALVAPHPAISEVQFEIDEASCKIKASEISVKNHEKSLHLDHVGIGSAIGGLVGLAIPGGSSWTAAVGFVGGGLMGLKDSLMGYRGVNREKELAVLNNEFQRCMFKKGHVIPGLPVHPGVHEKREATEKERESNPR